MIADPAVKGKDHNRLKKQQNLKKYWPDVVPQEWKIACFFEHIRGKQGVTG
jgi:hypothetical protein